ncbi:hypothetical protein ElyMa_005213100 [Elysia marginata]|uniref:Uncharacterized protein n=1 Tax=Elysia marginata TaxID=1093978 RepID=A0AAV4JXG7_9GAST|nr:hypothetical protein ElyMa_005213100 [Elysia marginata]
MQNGNFPTEMPMSKRRHNRNSFIRESPLECSVRRYYRTPAMGLFGVSPLRGMAQALVLLTVLLIGAASSQDYRIPTSNKEDTDTRETALQPGM